ncbi:MAG TPA: MFS transporter [Candidatus Acidoferrales bacterium]|nr:MFS transporter [Candidatus Acidoferrales bacterium]
MQSQPPGRLAVTILAHAVLRIASSASGVLIGIYLASLSGHGLRIDVRLLGVLGAASFAAELVFSIPFGIASDAISPRWLMVAGALTGALAVQLFAWSTHVGVFFLSRTLEGMGVAAVTPPLLAYLADATTHEASLRARVMSFFELSLLAGLALGGLMGSEFWQHFHVKSFSLVALAYIVCAALLAWGAKGSTSHGHHAAVQGLLRALKDPSVRSLAPVWLCVNAIVGLWLGPTLSFLLTHKAHSSQYLDGIFRENPTHVGWLLLGYSIVFGLGVTGWSFVLPHLHVRSAMRIALWAMLPVCLGLFAINHSGQMTSAVRWFLTAATALLVMVESGFTPAALAWLAQSLGTGTGKGAAMGIYSVLLSLGAIGGSLLAGELGKTFQVDGLLLGTAAMGVCGLVLLQLLKSPTIRLDKENYEPA